MIIALVVIVVFFGFATGGTIIWPRNVQMLVRQNAYVLILAIGMMFCILTGGNVDLSVGSLVALVSAMSGLMASKLGLPSWLAMDEGLPIMLILLVALYAIYTFAATKTILGRHVYAMGGNIKAAELSGVNTKKMMFLVYANMGLLAGVAGIITAGRSMAASPNVGVNFELDAIGACFIGGASAYGGVGTIWGAVVGAFIMGVMNNGMSIIGLDVFLQSVAKGMVVLLAVAFDMYSKSKSRLG